MRMAPSMVAALLYKQVARELGRVPPTFVERVFEYTKDTLVSEVQQMAPELEKLIAELDEPTRARMFADVRRLELRYELYSNYKDVDCFELTGRCERTADQLRAEKAQ